jgi:hypothetical protein
MRLLRFIEFLRRHLKTVVRLCLVLLAALVVIDAIPALVDKHDKVHTWAEAHLPGFWSLFGVVGCVLLILLSKAFGRAGIMQREDYYDE